MSEYNKENFETMMEVKDKEIAMHIRDKQELQKLAYEYPPTSPFADDGYTYKQQLTDSQREVERYKNVLDAHAFFMFALNKADIGFKSLADKSALVEAETRLVEALSALDDKEE